MEDLERKIKRESFKNGLFLGAVLLVLSIFTFYYITVIATPGMAILLGPIFFSIIIPIVAVIFFCSNIRKNIGGYWNFKQATTGIFIMFIMAYAVQTVGRDLIFSKIIEPDMVHKMQVAVDKASTMMLEKNGGTQAKIDEKKAEIQKQFDGQKNVTVGSMIQSYVFSLLFVFVFALIFAAIFKRDMPAYLLQAEEEVNS